MPTATVSLYFSVILPTSSLLSWIAVSAADWVSPTTVGIG